MVTFKARLIQRADNYYRGRRWSRLWLLLPAIFGAFIINMDLVPIWVVWGCVLLCAAGFYFSWRQRRRMESARGENRIELDDREARVVARGGNVLKRVPLDSLERILLQLKYGIPMEDLDGIADELKGVPQKNRITLYRDGQPQHYDFEVDSYYMVQQLEKLAEIWRRKGYPVQRKEKTEAEAEPS